MYFLYVERLVTYFQAFENFYLTGIRGRDALDPSGLESRPRAKP